MSDKPMDRETKAWHEMYERWESEKEPHALTRSTGSDRLQDASDKAERFICEWTCAESLEEMKRDSWSTSDVHSILLDFILSQNTKDEHA